MGRVSLTEAYDDRSVIAKLNEMDKRVTENTTVVTAAEASAKASAQAAQETADRFAGSVGAVVQNANQQINASKAQVDQAKAEVDETVTTVAQAVQTANNASASAQQSAQTVAGYDSRLTAVEDADTKNVKLDTNQVITGAKTFKVRGDPIIIQAPDIDGNAIPSENLYSEIDVRDSEGREIAYFIRRHQANGDTNVGMVCKHTRLGLSADISAFVTNDGKTYGIAPTPSNGAPSYAIATKGYVESTDGETNNLVHRTTNETINGVKTFTSPLTRSITSGGQSCISAIGVQGNTYAIVGLDTNNVQRHTLNMQIGSDSATRYSFQLRTPDYSATTGYDCGLTLELTTSGRLRLIMNRTDKSTGQTKSHVVGELQ